MRRIDLGYTPLSMQVVDYSPIAQMLNLSSRGGMQTLVVTGTKEGKVVVWYISESEHKVIGTTRSGLFFGEVSAVAMQEKGSTNMVAASSASEIVSFDLNPAIRAGMMDEQV